MFSVEELFQIIECLKLVTNIEIKENVDVQSITSEIRRVEVKLLCERIGISEPAEVEI